MKKILHLVLVLAGTLAVNAGTLERTRAWAENVGPEKTRSELGVLGIKSETNLDAIAASWDESVVVEKALQEDALGLLVRVLARDKLRAESVQLVLAHEQAKPDPSSQVWRFALYLPREQQQAFENLMMDLLPGIYEGRPVAGELAEKYEVRQGRPTVSVDSETADLVSMLLAPEPMRLWNSERLKKTIKDQSVELARRHLRETGRSFVTQDGVNPLTEAVAPVVEALNAPMCEGLEAALRGLGADIADRDRASLQAVTVQWREEVMLGDLSTAARDGVLGRLAIGLGVEPFNRFVEEYNHGTANPGN